MSHIIDVNVFENSGLFNSSKWVALDPYNEIGGDIYKLDGNVGIGTTTPLVDLHINNSQVKLTDSSSISLDDNNQIDLRWCCGDMPEEYEEQLKKQPKDWFWRDREVRYMCNWNGYRARDWEDYDWSESIVVLGCSMAYGVGVSNEDTF